MWQGGGGRGLRGVYVTHTIRQDQEKANEIHGPCPCILHYASESSNSAAAAPPSLHVVNIAQAHTQDVGV